jgi:hypothetical protein
MRPYWKGYLKLALVSCPIALHAASSSAERIAFRQINKATGNRLRQQLSACGAAHAQLIFCRTTMTFERLFVVLGQPNACTSKRTYLRGRL